MVGPSKRRDLLSHRSIGSKLVYDHEPLGAERRLAYSERPRAAVQRQDVRQQGNSAMLTVYLDQNVFGHILDGGPDWSTHPLVVAMLQTHSSDAAVWVSPSHIIELVQCSDPERRQSLARIMLALCGSRRMWAGPDFFMVEQFGGFLNSHVPGAFNPEPFFAQYKTIAERLWLGYLGLLAASPVLPLGPGVEEVRLAKAQTSLMHARIAADPDTSIKRIIDCAKNFETTPDPDPLGLEGMSLADIEVEMAKLRAAKVIPKRNHIQALKKARSEVAAAYGAVDIGSAIAAIFKLPCDLELTFDTPALVAAWPMIKKATGAPGLPKATAMAQSDELRATRSHVVTVLQACMHAAAHAKLTVTSVGYYTVLRELEVKLNQGSLPKGSVAIDADHATACLAFQAFLCHDHAFYENMRTFTNGLNNAGAKVFEKFEDLEATITTTSV